MIIPLFFSSLLFFLVIAFYFGAPFVPSKKEAVSKMLGFLDLKPDMKVIDLGSGDGRILIELARRGVRAVGIEIVPHLVVATWVRLFISGTFRLAQVRWGSYWQADFSPYDAIVVYAMPGFMKRLSEKIRKECKSGTKVVSNSFAIPDLPLISSERIGKTMIYLYRLD